MQRAEGRGKKKNGAGERGGLLAVEVVHYCRGENGLPLILSGPVGLILIVSNIGHLLAEMACRHLGVSAALRHKHTESEMKLLHEHKHLRP